jgi:hypothetical protein
MQSKYTIDQIEDLVYIDGRGRDLRERVEQAEGRDMTPTSAAALRGK